MNMSSAVNGLVEFLNTQYDRIEKRERGRRTIRLTSQAVCPNCGRPVGGYSTSIGRGDVILDPCGCVIPHAQFVELWGESAADSFVLADIASKRRILSLHRRDGEDGSDPICNVCLYTPPCETVRLLAAPFSAEPGYKPEWAV